jgi:predicted transcriptional regulator
MKKIVSITLDDKTKSRLDEYGKKHAISRSSALRMIVNDFFETKR